MASTRRLRGIPTVPLCLLLITVGSKITAAQTSVSWQGCGTTYPALTCVGSAEDDCQDNKALTRCVLSDNIGKMCTNCDSNNCCTTDGSDCSGGNCKSNVCINPDPKKYLTTLMVGLTGDDDTKSMNKKFVYGISEFESKMEFISQWTICTTEHSIAYMQITFQNGTQVGLGNKDEFKSSQCSTGIFGPTPPIVTYASIYKSSDNARKKPGVKFLSDSTTLLSRKASCYNDQCSVNYPGSGLLVGLAGVAATKDGGGSGEVAQLTPLFLRAIDSFTIQSTTLPAESDLNAQFTPAQVTIKSGIASDCTKSPNDCDFTESGSATTGGTTSYTDMMSSTWGKVLSLGFSASIKVNMKTSETSDISAKLGVDGNMEGSWSRTTENTRETTESTESTVTFDFRNKCPAGCACDYLIYQYQGQITSVSYAGQYVVTLKGGSGVAGVNMTWDISKVTGSSANFYNTSMIRGQPWLTVVVAGSNCADVEAPPSGFGTPETGRKLLQTLDDAPAPTAAAASAAVAAVAAGSGDVDASTFIKRSPKPIRPKPCRNKHGRIIPCPKPSPSPSPKPIKNAVRMYYSMSKRIAVYHNPDKPCPVYHAGTLPTSAEGQAAVAKLHNQDWKHIAAAQRLLPAKRGMYVVNRCACKLCSNAAKGMA